MGKTKLIALSAVCSAMAVVCMMLCSLTFWAALFLSVLASLAVVVPLLVEPKALVYSLLSYAVSSVLGVFFSVAVGNVAYVAPCVAFCMPFAIVKVYGETVKLSAEFAPPQTIENPFGEKDTHVVEVKLDGKKRLHPIVKWVLFYVLLEAGIGLTLLSAYLLTPPLFHQIVQNKYFYLLIAAFQLIPIPYNLLMRGCLIATTKILHKIIK